MRTARTIRMIRMIRSSANGANGANGADGADGTNWCELVRIGNPMDWQTGRRKRRKDRAKKTGLRKRRPYDPARKPD